MKENDKVSIIVPVYNAEKTIGKTIESILNQSYPFFELLIINDGSIDSTQKICDEYVQTDNRIRIISQPNMGPSVARNTGITQATGNWIAFVDGDDIIHPNMIELLMRALSTNNCDMAVCNAKKVESQNISFQSVSHVKSTVMESIEVINKAFINKIPLYCWGKLMKKSLFADIKFPEGQYYEDEITCFRLFVNSTNIAVISDPLYYYVQTPTGITKVAKEKHAYDLIQTQKEIEQLLKNVNGIDIQGLYAHLCSNYTLAYNIAYRSNSNRKLLENISKLNKDALKRSNLKNVLLQQNGQSILLLQLNLYSYLLKKKNKSNLDDRGKEAFMDDIDIVVTWVDGNDPKWQKSREKYAGDQNNSLNSSNRYRDWDLMRYWFRAIETYAPWVNCVYFVTCGHYPDWLNLNHPKLKLIKHSDYMPEDALPTFNSNAIELGINKIEGLSDKFILFNDDFFIIDKIEKSDFFQNDLPCDFAALDAIEPSEGFDYILMNNIRIINKNFNKMEVLKKHRSKWFNTKDIKSVFRTMELFRPWNQFTGFRDYHIPVAYLKKEFDDMWERYPDLMDQTVHHRVRSKEDISHWLIRYWRLASGTFVPFSQKKWTFIPVTNGDNSFLIDTIKNQKKKIICINDNFEGEDILSVQKSLKDAFETILPNKSSFEL